MTSDLPVGKSAYARVCVVAPDVCCLYFIEGHFTKKVLPKCKCNVSYYSYCHNKTSER